MAELPTEELLSLPGLLQRLGARSSLLVFNVAKQLHARFEANAISLAELIEVLAMLPRGRSISQGRLAGLLGLPESQSLQWQHRLALHWLAGRPLSEVDGIPDGLAAAAVPDFAALAVAERALVLMQAGGSTPANSFGLVLDLAKRIGGQDLAGLAVQAACLSSQQPQVGEAIGALAAATKSSTPRPASVLAALHAAVLVLPADSPSLSAAAAIAADVVSWARECPASFALEVCELRAELASLVGLLAGQDKADLLAFVDEMAALQAKPFDHMPDIVLAKPL